MTYKKTFIITGANRGLGKSLTTQIMSVEEHQVISISRRQSKEQENYNKEKFSFVNIDLSNKIDYKVLEQLESIVKSDEIVFINNASLINPISKTGTFNQNQIDDIISVNIRSSVIICNFILEKFKEKKITMINISSGAAKFPISSWSLYCTSKAAIHMFFEVMKVEHPACDFHSIDPGVMNTKMQSYIRDSEFDKVDDFIEFKNKGVLKTPDEIANTILTPYL